VFRANAVVILYALQIRNVFEVQYTKDGVDPELTSQNDEDRRKRRRSVTNFKIIEVFRVF
jgi:hypothetical protein